MRVSAVSGTAQHAPEDDTTLGETRVLSGTLWWRLRRPLSCRLYSVHGGRHRHLVLGAEG